jgi:hypothetical protein
VTRITRWGSIFCALAILALVTTMSARTAPRVASVTWAQQKLVIKADHSRVKSGEILYVTGTGFIPDRAVIAHMIRPDKTEYNTLRLRANASGELVHKIDTVMLDIGTFELWVEDEASKATSNRIQFTVESNLHEL